MDTTKSGGLLQPLPIPLKTLPNISMDFVESLTKSHGYEVVLVVVDRLIQYVHFILLPHPFIATKVAAIFMREVFKLHGMPQSIVSDRDAVFTSNFWAKLFKLQGTELTMSSAYHPQSDGQIEVVNQSLELYLRAFVGDNPYSWVTWLQLAEF